jgi:hypothetical protein
LAGAELKHVRRNDHCRHSWNARCSSTDRDRQGFPLRPKVGRTPSRTGIRVDLGGYFGLSIGWVEGIEISILGAVAGIDIRRPALKLAGLGRLGMPLPTSSTRPMLPAKYPHQSA